VSVCRGSPTSSFTDQAMAPNVFRQFVKPL
jgi:hypothetical protein